MKTKSEKIRETYRSLPVGSSNRDVAEAVERQHGVTVTPQGPQVLEAKATAQHFPSFDAYHDCVGMLRRITSVRRGTLE